MKPIALSKYHTYDPDKREHHFKYPYYPAPDEYKMPYPGKEAYHFPTTTKHTSPCMSLVWRAIPLRQGKKRDEIDFEVKIDDEEGEL